LAFYFIFARKLVASQTIFFRFFAFFCFWHFWRFWRFGNAVVGPCHSTVYRQKEEFFLVFYPINSLNVRHFCPFLNGVCVQFKDHLKTHFCAATVCCLLLPVTDEVEPRYKCDLSQTGFLPLRRGSSGLVCLRGA
jgi:hypothetical protein